MERNDRPHAPLAGRLWFGAPVAMVLATCVSAPAPAAEIVPSTLQPSADMSVVVRGQAPQARKVLAQHAAYAIHAADRIVCSHLLEAGREAAGAALESDAAVLWAYGLRDPSSTNRQTSAP
ncbi:MAG: hypothetical protein KIS92_19355 [Planctomycetota bacterium]|nr:hypothetical protein [Planctomycetota bacterium]